MKRLIVVALCVALLTGCQTTTRLGDVLIPAHPDSYKLEDKIVFAYEQKPEEQKAFVIPWVPAAAMVIDMAQKKIADELRREAKKYTQQYSGKRRYELKQGTYYITMLRLVRSGNKQPATDPAFDPIRSTKTISIPPMNELGKVYVDSDAIPDDRMRNTVEEVGRVYKDYLVASAVMFEVGIRSENKVNFGWIDLKAIYFHKAKAKVVGLSAWPWHWIGDLLLKTGDVVKVDVHATLNGINDKGAATTLLDSDFPQNGHEVALGEPTTKTFTDLGDWISMGGVEGHIPVTINIRVTERDPSNVQKLLQDSADRVEKSSALKDLLPKE